MMKVLSLEEIKYCENLLRDESLLDSDIISLLHTAREYHRLLHAVKGDKSDYNSVDCVLACMAEGEGSDPQVYMTMAKGALTRLREALKDDDEK